MGESGKGTSPSVIITNIIVIDNITVRLFNVWCEVAVNYYLFVLAEKEWHHFVREAIIVFVFQGRK